MSIQRLPGEQPLFSDLYLTPDNQPAKQASLFSPSPWQPHDSARAVAETMDELGCDYITAAIFNNCD